MLTAAVRDLHRCYPSSFVTDVRTFCPELWENNPYVTPLSQNDSDVECIDCTYPLISSANVAPYHCLHGFIEFFNQRLNLAIKPTLFKGDIHLSPKEKAWYSQVHEVTREDIPFWIICAGGKYDITIKWWDIHRYQEVVDHFRGRVQFVQVGQDGHHHPKLNGVIDLRGQTNLRELVRLVYHSQGVLCSVTSLMHLAAAVEVKNKVKARRPCVVVAGGREPAHWEAYPGHQFIHTVGALPCCRFGGCWRDRTVPLRDGDSRDRKDSLCLDVHGTLPRCMDWITPAEVIRRIEMFFRGGQCRYLSLREHAAAERGAAATVRYGSNGASLNLHEAGLACDEATSRLPPYGGNCSGRGIVICAGGPRYLTCAWVCVNMLRHLGSTLPIQIWHLGPRELDRSMANLLRPLGVECVDAALVRRRFPARILKGWELKAYSILHSPFREVLFLDADNVPVVNPEFLFETSQFRQSGAIFWPDLERLHGVKQRTVWRSCGLSMPSEQEFETGQIVVDKARCWEALCLTMWFNENSDFYYQYVHGDKETFHLAFRKVRKSYSLVPTPVFRLDSTMCQHDFEGRRIFQHRNMDKWDIFPSNKRIAGFEFEDQCRDFIIRLRDAWPERSGKRSARTRAGLVRTVWTTPKIAAVMISCTERAEMRSITLNNLARTDWGDEPVTVQSDHETHENHRERQVECALLALKAMIRTKADYFLFLEDDLDFNRYIRHNLQQWEPVRKGTVTLASLYNPRVHDLGCDIRCQARIVDPRSVFGSQAFLLSRHTANYIVRRWEEVHGMQDIRMSRLAACLGKPLLYHAPSLVQHIGQVSVWGGGFHQAFDFDPDWQHPVHQSRPCRVRRRPSTTP